MDRRRSATVEQDKKNCTQTLINNPQPNDPRLFLKFSFYAKCMIYVYILTLKKSSKNYL